MFRLLRELWFGPPRPGTRMTEEQVRALADKAVREAHMKHNLGCMTTVSQINGRIVWSVRGATVGSGWFVDIDDATGEVGPVRRWGIR
jgi:hypothetical protein